MNEDKKVNDIRTFTFPLVTADKEYEVYLPKGVKFFTLHVRDGTAIRMSHLQGRVSGSEEPYFTLKANTSWDEQNVDVNRNIRWYVACGSASKVVEVIAGVYDPALEPEEEQVEKNDSKNRKS